MNRSDVLKQCEGLRAEIIQASHPPDGQPGGGGPGNPTGRKAERIIQRQAENERKIKAVEQAWAAFSEPYQREFIRLNLFENIRMDNINLPISLRSMKRLRHKFLINVAENLHEI